MGIFDRGNYTVTTFSDLSKAFDTWNRSKLIRILRCYGVNGRALERCVSQRNQFVGMLDVSSPTIPIDIGIAQCSCLDPLMFIIEINFQIYADDTTLYVSAADIGQCKTYEESMFITCVPLVRYD